MAIDLFCYCSLDADMVREELALLVEGNPNVFPSKFLISVVTDLTNAKNHYDLVEIEIARENGLAALSSFIVGLNDKKAVDLLSAVKKMIKKSLGEERVLIFLNNEERR
ncbi:hypothetical protein IB278_17065 [Variovorax sp. VRV01]|uniref:hypothetical protein n=1 Tax=Variovorax sp. VRV01 TaxID=2769259 RepID=UPI00177CAFFC|nr:hypothetical protein [Variovorax sp. VRV01]MBD9665681.1 hypothetical protein [Variovorax sp. VRV01]